eukprot:TRINITY_DN14215_c0_g1_i1.p2 TRINITY_DN14215_c0_g1~~TRINITY_DN14215_c0_g1_i1.p2  ORF type:complete len:54 (-),score=10.99 TRINITY_DN14215_c0_g1_i1:81-242(-)
MNAVADVHAHPKSPSARKRTSLLTTFGFPKRKCVDIMNEAPKKDRIHGMKLLM